MESSYWTSVWTEESQFFFFFLIICISFSCNFFQDEDFSLSLIIPSVKCMLPTDRALSLK